MIEGDGESFDTADDGNSWLPSLLALRADIAGGDERSLYLALPLDVQCGVIDDDAIEPAPPSDLIAVAAQGAPLAAAPSVRDVERWLNGLDTSEPVALLSRLFAVMQA